MVAGIVLAAGSGARIGHPKALLAHPEAGWFLARACAVLRRASVDEVVAVVAPAIARVAERLSESARVLINDEPARGQLSSLQVALRSLDPSVAAALVLPVDVPLVQPQTVRAIIDAWRRGGALVLRPSNANRHGHPVLFARPVFDELLHADPAAATAKEVVRRHSAHGDVAVEDEGAFVDIDTAADYVAAFGRLPEAFTIE